MTTPSKTKQENEKKRTEEFLQYVAMFREWFAWEEIEVSDQVLGRFASHLQSHILKLRATYKKDLNDFEQEMIRQRIYWKKRVEQKVQEERERLTSPVKEPSIEYDTVCTQHGRQGCTSPHKSFDSKEFLETAKAVSQTEEKEPDFRTDQNTGDQYCATCGVCLDEYGKCTCKPMRKKKGS